MLHKSHSLVHKIKYHPKPIKTNELPTFFFLFPYFLNNQTKYNLTKKKKKGVIIKVILSNKTETKMKKKKRERPVREKDQRNSSIAGSVAN